MGLSSTVPIKKAGREDEKMQYKGEEIREAQRQLNQEQNVSQMEDRLDTTENLKD